MPQVESVRLRALALGIRPTLAAECGLEPRGTVDILDANGLTGWRIGVRQLLDDGPLVDWAHAELRAEVERWRYLAAFVDTLEAASTRLRPEVEEDETRSFWQGWCRNMGYALDVLMSRGLVVSPAAVGDIRVLAESLGGSAGGLLPLLGRLRDEASGRVDRSAGDPPPLVLPEYRDDLVAALGEGSP